MLDSVAPSAHASTEDSVPIPQTGMADSIDDRDLLHASAAITGDERFDLELLRRAIRYQRWTVAQFGPRLRGELLEVGAGIGNFTRWLAPLASRVVALEPDQAMCEELRALGLPNVEVVPQPVEALRGGERFDSVVMFNVLEHIRDEPGVLRVLLEQLRPGGSVNLLVPAHARLFGTLDRRYGHFRRYTKDGVRRLLRAAGFDQVRASYFNPVGAVGWFVAGRILRMRRLSPSAVRLSDAVAVPVGRLLERLGRAPFGQSVVATGVRPLQGAHRG
jgi:SAM-dependent methyltransferase